jgi:hypothetical protein
MNQASDTLSVQRVGEIAAEAPEDRWLVRGVWGREAVGIIGGPPKCCKSWLGLDLATSVASGTPCLDRFPIDDRGPALIFLAEDALAMVRARVEALCGHRRLDIGALDLHVITAPALRLDLEDDRQRLAGTLDRLRPKVVVLDPLVRLHRLDENSAADISGLLGFLRELQRAFAVAVVLVHHASKKQRAHPGQALRGSSDLHAFGDSNAYLTRQRDQLVLTLEHRAARPPEPLSLRLVSADDGTRTHLEVVGGTEPPPTEVPLARVILDHLAAAEAPMPRTALRAALRVNNNRLGHALGDLETGGKLQRTPDGWQLAPGATQLSLLP